MDKANINDKLDLQEATRRDNVYSQLNEIIDKLEAIEVYPSLLWAWTFDIIRNSYEGNLEVTEWSDEVIRDGVTLKQIFDKFWDDVDNLGIDMDLGGEVIEECILDWMRENDFLVALDDDGWLDD